MHRAAASPSRPVAPPALQVQPPASAAGALPARPPRFALPPLPADVVDAGLPPLLEPALPVLPPFVTLTEPPLFDTVPPVPTLPLCPGLEPPTPPVPAPGAPPLPPPPLGTVGPVNRHQLNLNRSPLPPTNFKNRSCFPLPPLTAQVLVVQVDAPDTSHVPSDVPV